MHLDCIMFVYANDICELHQRAKFLVTNDLNSILFHYTKLLNEQKPWNIVDESYAIL